MKQNSEKRNPLAEGPTTTIQTKKGAKTAQISAIFVCNTTKESQQNHQWQ
jgi:hypothetical protein